MNSRKALVASAIFASFLTACGSSATGSQTVTATSSITVTATAATTVTASAPPAVTVTAAPATASPAASTSSSQATAAADKLSPWGEPQLLSERKSVTVHEVRIPADIDGPEAGAGLAWAAVDAEFCVPDGAAGVEVSWYPWTLTAGSRMFDASSSTYNAFPKPQYPFVEAIAAGECGRGWIVFAAPADGTVDQVRYDASGENGAGAQIVRWSATAA